jgi:hypothetical protein
MSTIIYNTTIQPQWAIHDNWLHWMKTEHIPEVVRTGCFTHSQLLRLLETEETEGPTYAIQYFALTKDFYNQYIETYGTTMRQKVADKWGNQLVVFRSLLQVV